MSVKVEMVSCETIRPSSPSPPQDKIYKLSCLDQVAPQRYMPILFCYNPTHLSSQNDAVERLKSSLSTLLDHYYPLAGRYNDEDGVSIVCNGQGVPFLVSNVAGDMLSRVTAPDEDCWAQLLPCLHKNRMKDGNGKLILLAVQVNFFQCGGIALGICAWHGVADSSTVSCLAQCWAAICRGDPAVYHILPQAVLDYTPIFPSQLHLTATKIPSGAQEVAKIPSDNTNINPVVVKRFVFPANKIAMLRQNMSANHTSNRPPTRVEAVSSLVWAATIRLAQEKRKEKGMHQIQDGGDGYHSAVMVVNLRTRTIPPLPAVCMGNIIQVTEKAKWPIDCELTEENMGDLAAKLAAAVRAMNHDYITSLRQINSKGHLNLAKSFQEEQKEDFLMISSSCRYPIYGADFGWGKPVFVHGFSPRNNIVVLLDASDGEGIEAWVTLSKKDMSRFDKDSTILYHSL